MIQDQAMTYAIGDIHGEVTLLHRLLALLPFREEDKLVFLGDYEEWSSFEVTSERWQNCAWADHSPSGILLLNGVNCVLRLREGIMTKDDRAFSWEMSVHVGRNIVGRNIRDMRTKRGWTQEQLGSPEISSSYISAVEEGKLLPSSKLLSIIAKRLDVPLMSLLEDNPKSEET